MASEVKVDTPPVDASSSDSGHERDEPPVHDQQPEPPSSSTAKDVSEYERKKANALLANPLRGYSLAELGKMGKAYALEHALVEPEDFRAFELGAQLAQNPKGFESVEGLTEEEKTT